MNFCMKINIKVFYKLIPSFFVAIARHVQSTQNNKFTISQGRREGWSWFLHADKQKRPYKMILPIVVGVVSRAQSTWNGKFVKYLQCLKKEVRSEVDLCADKHQSFPQVDNMKFNRHIQASVTPTFIFVPLNQYGYPNIEPKFFRTRFVRRP